MTGLSFKQKTIETPRHRTAWIEAGPEHGPLMIFLHGWPELGLVWRGQMHHFADQGWRCIAPDMRGYGRSSRPSSVAAYAVRELVADMVEMHDALGSSPAIWVGHDWGSAVAWAMASHHAERCPRRRQSDRSLPRPRLCLAQFNSAARPYPEDRYPVGQWDYWLYYRENFARASQAFEADVRATLALLYRRAPEREASEPALTASVRARGGWFGGAGRAPAMPRDETLTGQDDFEALVEAFTATGFGGADAWYMNDAANLAYAAEAPNFGRITLPALFIHATNDDVCDTTRSRLADPMREDCANLTEATIEGGHEIMLERSAAVNDAISDWLASPIERVQDVSARKK